MQKDHANTGAGRGVYQLPDSVKSRLRKHQQQAVALLNAYQRGDAEAIAEFQGRHPDADKPDFQPTLLAARMLTSGRDVRVHKLSLEKLKKEAKDLLKLLKQGDLEAFARRAEHQANRDNNADNPPKLADAQFIIARENGLPSWPKLKAHIEAITLAASQIKHPSRSPDGDLKTLHIRCGNDIKTALQTCGFNGEFLEVSNPFPQGRVPPFDPVDDFINIRTQFIHDHYSGDVPQHYIDDSASEIRKVEETLRHADKGYQRIVMWYEHDAFDQLSKTYVLAHLAQLDLSHTVVECVQIDSFPGVKKFIGIGQLSQTPAAILSLWPQRQTVTPAMIAFGARCWQAFIADDPTQLWQLCHEQNAALPDMQKAYIRMLMELPWRGNGLSLTAQLALHSLAEEGPMRPGGVFNLLMTELDPQPYLGDIMLLTILRPLWQSHHAAIEIQETFDEAHPMRKSLLAITELGRALLKGEANWLQLTNNQPFSQRHVGGVNISYRQPEWYWSPEDNKPVFQ